jgi:hypothetical protein
MMRAVMLTFLISGFVVRSQNLLRGPLPHDRYSEMIAADVGNSAELTLGNNTFSSKLEFILNGSRCRNFDYTEVQQYENNQLLKTLPPEAPGAALRLRSVLVYLHIIMSSTGQESVSNSVIATQLSVLNRAYGDSLFTFALAGVTRTRNDSWYSAKINSAGITAMKRALRKGSYSDLNVYTTAQTDSTLGWATMPTKVGNEISFDGVVIDYPTMPGGAFWPYNEGHTLTHETGHWLGLAHTFQGGCAVDPALGDEIADTPAEREGNFGCPSDRTNSCAGNVGALVGRDPIHNYMDYVDDGCMDSFTADQGTRMRRMFSLYRSG